MATYCIPKVKIEEFKKVFNGLGDKNQLETLSNMSSAKRVDLFKNKLTTDEAVLLNKEFEKAIGSEKLSALKNWVRNNLDEKYREHDIDAFKKRFQSLDEVNDFIEGKSKLMAEQKQGIALSNEEVKKFTELGKELFDKVKYLDEGLIENEKGMLEFGKALKNIQDYSESLKPIGKWRAYVQNIGRVNMLASIKTPFLNIESNTISGLTEAIGRRLSNWKAYGNVESSVAKQYRKSALKLFKETGLDISRMITIEEPITGAGRMIGEESGRTSSKVLNAYSDFIFNKTLTTPDVFFGNFAFTDSANIISSRLAKGDEKLATNIFKDATLLNPRTEQGKIARLEAIAGARRATYTDDSWSSKFALATRKLLNNVPGLGDILMPFVKTVGNVAELGADYAGLGFVKGATKGVRLGISKMKGEAIDRNAVVSAFNDIVRSGLGMTAAYALVSQIDVNDFMGAYDPSRTGIDQLSNTSYNAIRVQTPLGEKWISLDYLGALAPSVVGMLYAKKYGEKEMSQGLGYLSGVASQYVAQMPVFDPLSSFVGEVNKFDPSNSKALLSIFGDKTLRSFTDTVVSRMIPGITYDMARATDEYQRDNRQGKYTLGGVNFDNLIQKIPYLRKGLPIKYDGLGRLMHEEGLETFLFGARVRTNKADAIVDEIYRLRDNGQKPNVRDLRFSTSSKVAELKNKVGKERFYDIAREFGESISIEYKKTMDSQSYKNASDEEKKKKLDSVMEIKYKQMMYKNGVTYK